ncbi:MAG TPA: peptidylprolyl isomerase [Pirellulales bacterium]|nr:peptidylprolyl isomerase [Pirellulales bacterium]
MNFTDADPVPTPRCWRRRLGWLTVAAAVLAICAVARYGRQTPIAKAQSPLKKLTARPAAKTTKTKKTPSKTAEEPPAEAPAAASLKIMATVNGQQITRNELAQECLLHFGEEVLESVINKRLISEECRKRNIAVTHDEVKEEIDRMAARFALPTEQLLTMLREERHITPDQYAKEIIWPTVALRKLAADRLKVSEKDLQEAYDMLYGPAVQVRLIACPTAQKAEEARARAIADPEDFGNIAKEVSIDTVSASAKGLIQPIHHHQGDPNIERVAFGLHVGEVSEVVAVGDQFVILMCEAQLAAQKVPMEKVKRVLVESIKDKKLRLAADTIFKQLQDAAQIENVMNDRAKSKQHPGVAAIVNGQTITIRDVAEECLERHGIEMLEGIVNRRILEQACRQRKIEVTEADMQREIAHAAVSMGKTKGHTDEPDIDGWLKDVVENQKISLALYKHDIVWPSAALTKLVGGDVAISQDDLKKSFEANFGPKVRCRAIVLASQRSAQDCWAKAREAVSIDRLMARELEKNPAWKKNKEGLRKYVVEKVAGPAFGKLATELSVDPASRADEGIIPPIQKHGGEPFLEKEAFALKRGEISGIIQANDKWVILFCEGRTTPLDVKFEDVKQQMVADLREKKMRLAMAQEFTKLQEDAQIDNFMTGKSQPGIKGKRLQDSLLASPEASLLAPEGQQPPSKPRPAGQPKPRAVNRPDGAMRR